MLGHACHNFEQLWCAECPWLPTRPHDAEHSRSVGRDRVMLAAGSMLLATSPTAPFTVGATVTYVRVTSWMRTRTGSPTPRASPRW